MLNQAGAQANTEARDPAAAGRSEEIGVPESLDELRKRPQLPTNRTPQEALQVYEQIPPTLVVESLPESVHLWTHIILSAEQGTFMPPLIQEHEFGIFINAGDLYTRYHLTPGEEVVVSLARGRVLELGAGFGRVSRALREHGFEVVTTDADPAIVKMYRARGWSEACELTLPDIPASLGQFDTVIALRGVLSVVGEIDQVYLSLQRIRERLNPGGRLMFTSSKVTALLPISGRSPLEYRVRFIYQGCRSPWLRETALPEWLAVPLLRGLGFSNIQIFDPAPSEGAGYYALASLSR